jgi:hypothetical protein
MEKTPILSPHAGSQLHAMHKTANILAGAANPQKIPCVEGKLSSKIVLWMTPLSLEVQLVALGDD